ncbi:inositol monophosphatase family protein [Cellulomonas humilata]|uniref:Myo-inositol-1(Or 4)-monophosphatase n=1 Tax=Cellulomonas humilata TaxID=144055 RepID=A0ABU0EBM8_9CELL|nr:inositol monophosphatase family protein [Cellulomonas humilata]MDQ0372672.1 myo-inositol-1(or 4)-monophosphatase [Cellulomonas humilata]
MNSLGDAEVAWAAAEAGAKVVRAAYGRPVTRHAKSGLDFATDADLDAERAILAVIAAARPGDAVLGEETGETGGPGTRRWLVDPLCGTVNFAAQTPLLAVNVALVDETGALACAVADPIARELFWSDGTGASLRHDGVDAPLCPSAGSRLVDVNCDGPLDRPFVGPQLLGDPAFRADFGPRVLSTTLALAWVAAGRRAAYVSDGAFVDNVHFAAGIGLCQAAGCVVTNLTGGAVGTGRGLIAAADEPTHRRLLDLVRPHLSS